MIKAVVFDVGECLVDGTKEYGIWADWLGVPRPSRPYSVAVIAQGMDYRETFQVFRPGFDLTEEREKRAAAGQAEWFGEDDLYTDARSTLAKLRTDGLWVGIAGNQTKRGGDLLRSLDLPLGHDRDIRRLGVSKPDPEFFSCLVEATPFEVTEILCFSASSPCI